MPAPAPGALIDRVDAHDVPTGVVERGRVFDEGANFRTVHVMLSDQAGRVLIQELGQRHGRNPGRWGSSAAGYLHVGESYEDGARRRLLEELGIAPELRGCGRTAMNDRGLLKFIGVFEGRVSPSAPRVQDPGHVARLCWVPLTDLVAAVSQRPEQFTETFLHVLTYWLDQRSVQA